ncbi:regulator of G-protein signaling 21 [Oryzias latipes]|uniref:Regulator of G protein signaling 13a n=2 Tax=Oryzias TaxID=8089 RepID=H2M5I1_ORYLA|nr:regulator of G-protein signaling 21 [Oryzias latipes]
MPSLVASPFDLWHQNMDSDDKKTERNRGERLRSRSISIATQALNTDGLCFEEMSQWSDSLERLLSSKCGMKVFQAFLKSEFSDENLEFWLVCEQFKKMKHSFRLSSRAKKIFKSYVQAEAPREINIDQKTRELIKWNMKTPSTTCFIEAQKIVFGLMEKDSYPRFLKSDLYRTLLNSTSESVKM